MSGIILSSFILFVLVHIWLLIPLKWLNLSVVEEYFLGISVVLGLLVSIFGFSFRIRLDAHELHVQHKFLGLPYKSIRIPMSILLDDYKDWKKDSLFFSKHVHLDYGLWAEDDDFIEITDGKKCLEVGSAKTSEKIMGYILQSMKSISAQKANG